MTKRKRTLRSNLMCRVALVSLVAGLAAGCSDAVERLGGGPIYTGGTANQRAILTGSAKQPTYEDIIYGSGGTTAGLPPASSAPLTTASIPTRQPPPVYSPQAVRPVVQQPIYQSGPIAPLQTQPLAHMPQTTPYAANVPVPTRSPLGTGSNYYRPAPVASAPVFTAPAPTFTAPAPVSNNAPLYTGSIPTTTPTVSNPVTWKGWTSAGGTRVPVRSGDTLHSMSRRFGVPVEAVAAVNGISDPSQVRSGQTLIIPTYVYSSNNGTTDATLAANAPVRLPAVQSSQQVQQPITTASTGSTGSFLDRIFGRAPVPDRKPGAGAQPTFEQIATGYVPAAQVPIATAPAGTQTAFVGAAPRAKPYAYGGGRPSTIAAVTSQAAEEDLTTASISGMSRPAVVPLTASVPVPRRQPVRKVSTAAKAPGVPARAPASHTTTAHSDPKPTQPIARPQEQQIASADNQAVEPAGPSFRWPVRGRIISEFGAKPGGGRNEGVNLAVPEGTPVKAAGDGTVIYSGNELKGYGNLVLVRHDDGWVSAYAHNSVLKVKRGDAVTRGDVVALAGATGSVSQPQVHFELRRGNKPVDPMKYLPRS